MDGNILTLFKLNTWKILFKYTQKESIFDSSKYELKIYFEGLFLNKTSVRTELQVYVAI